MVSRTVKIENAEGLHMRPAANLYVTWQSYLEIRELMLRV